MNEFDNDLNKAQLERIALLLEESGEVTHIIGKIIRHGYKSHNPDVFPIVDNTELLESELADFFLAVSLLHKRGDISLNNINVLMHSKSGKKNKYLHNNNIDFDPMFFKLKK